MGERIVSLVILTALLLGCEEPVPPIANDGKDVFFRCQSFKWQTESVVLSGDRTKIIFRSKEYPITDKLTYYSSVQSHWDMDNWKRKKRLDSYYLSLDKFTLDLYFSEAGSPEKVGGKWFYRYRGYSYDCRPAKPIL